MKTCLACQIEKPLSEFPPDKRARDGRQGRCRACINDWIKHHYRKHPAAHMVRRARSRAAKLGIDFDLTEADLLPLPEACPILGKPLRASTGPQDPWAYSLDRINNDRGYVPGNVAVMSYRANRLKNDGTGDEHQQIADWMKERRL